MYLSCLLIDTGTNPDRPRPGRLWIHNQYRVHQRLCMAFPSDPRKAEDLDFLKPYVPGEFAQKQVHVHRGTEAGILFRIDPQPAGRAVILVQSALEPNWDYAFHNASHLLIGPPQTKQIQPRFEQNQRLRFRLLANPTKRLRQASQHANGQPVEQRWVGKRVPVPNARLEEWLTTRAAKAGFQVAEFATVQPGYVYVNKTREAADGHRMRSVRFEGLLEVTDPERFRETLIRGIGPAKAFGFGLLSVAPVR